jgi:methyl-accepting chemotaxis protein
MRALNCWALLSLCVVYIYTQEKQNDIFHTIFPLGSFKMVIDTCMRSYTDALMIHDRIVAHEKIDELLDLIVGRLMRLHSYVDQLVVAYKNDATVTYDEIDYLIRMLEYLELTIHHDEFQEIAQALNTIIVELRGTLKNALGLVCYTITPMRLLPYWYQPIKYPLCRFALSNTRQWLC